MLNLLTLTVKHLQTKLEEIVKSETRMLPLARFLWKICISQLNSLVKTGNDNYGEYYYFTIIVKAKIHDRFK